MNMTPRTVVVGSLLILGVIVFMVVFQPVETLRRIDRAEACAGHVGVRLFQRLQYAGRCERQNDRQDCHGDDNFDQ